MPARAFITSKSEKTFLTVLDSATELFQTKGFHETSMRDVSRHSNLALGALYYYCKSKEELVLLFYERITDQIRASYSRRESKAKTLPDAFCEFMRLKMSKLTKYRKLLSVILKESFDPDSNVSPLSSASASTRDSSIALFQKMIIKFDSTAEDAQESALILWLLHMLILAFWLYDRSPKFDNTEKLLVSVSTVLSLSATFARMPGIQPLSQQLRSSILGILR